MKLSLHLHFTEEAIEILTKKKNIRLLTISFDQNKKDKWNTVSVEGGLLMQEPDAYGFADADIRVATDREPTEAEWEAMKLGWAVVKHVKSNAIVVSDDHMTLGVGAGQMNRVGAANIALHKQANVRKVQHLHRMHFSQWMIQSKQQRKRALRQLFNQVDL